MTRVVGLEKVTRSSLVHYFASMGSMLGSGNIEVPIPGLNMVDGGNSPASISICVLFHLCGGIWSCLLMMVQ